MQTSSSSATPSQQKDSSWQQYAQLDYAVGKLTEALQKAEQFLQGTGSKKLDLWEIWSFVVPFTCDIDPFLWLRMCGSAPRLYWSNRDGSFVSATWGISYCVPHTLNNEHGMRVLRQVLPLLNQTHTYHVLPFDTAQTMTPMWQPFSNACLFVPMLQLVYTNSAWRLHCIPFFGKETQAALACTKQILQQLPCMLQRVDPPTAATATWSLSQQLPQQSHWHNSITQALHSIACNDMHKVVLARQHILQSHSQQVDPLQLFLQLKQHAPQHGYCFFWQPNADQAFMGFSPERLYARQQNLLHTEAVAGTRPLGSDAAQNARWRQELLASTKDANEQQQVTEFLQRALSRFCCDRHVDERTVLSAGNVQHLVTRLRGTINSHATDADILSCLHPTPAVCGNPRSQAKAFIAQQEGFDRGYYSGTMGYVTKQQAEFAVAIRTALLNKNQLHVFAGAGVVAGSDPVSEWEETHTKMGIFNHLLDGS